MRAHRNRIAPSLAAAFWLAAAGAASAETYRGEYTVSFLGFTVARSSFDTVIEDGRYSLKGQVSAAGLARLFDDTSGTVSASGRFASGRARPDGFRADYTSAGKKGLVEMGFSRRGVTSYAVLPKPKPRGANWVELRTADLIGALDPMAAVLVPAGSPGEVCRGAAKAFDGEMRFDLTLSDAGTRAVETAGYAGEAVVCRMGFKPVSGYRKGRRALEFLERKSIMTVAFAPLGQTGIYAPIHATVGTEIGTLTVRARRFEQVK